MNNFYETVKSSPNVVKHPPFPFKTLKKGFSFIVKFGEVREETLRSAVGIANSKIKDSYFTCVKHNDLKLFEIANIGSKERKAKNMYNIVESSPQALFKDNLGEGKLLYPFKDLEEGKSFIVPIADAKEKSLRTLCYTQGRKYGKKFVLIKHEESGIYEIACLKKSKPVFYDNSPQALAKGVENAS